MKPEPTLQNRQVFATLSPKEHHENLAGQISNIAVQTFDNKGSSSFLERKDGGSHQ